MSELIAGKYELLEEIGKGGMGTVYRARHLSLDRIVAIKILSEELATTEEFRERFQHEATILAQLVHPNIVTVYDIEHVNNTYCIIMEYVEGKSLQKLIDERALKERDVLLVGAQIARALHYAHQHGVIHRDVKPDNILVTAETIAKITDFGIARWRGRGFNTQTGATLGTPRFMSPEQVTGRELDGRSDLYSLGVCLYYALTGLPPFDGENHYAVATRHLYNDPEPLRKLNPEISPAAEQVVLRALAKLPDARFANGEEMALALEAAAGARSPVIVASMGGVAEVPQGATRKIDFTPVLTLPPASEQPSRTTPTGRDQIAAGAPGHPTPAPVPAFTADIEEEVPVLPLKTEKPARHERWRAWLVANWGIVLAVVIVAGVVALGSLYPRNLALLTASPQRHVATEYDQMIESVQGALNEGRIKDALLSARAFKEKYPDYKAADVDNLIDRLTSSLPLTEVNDLAQRRAQKGKVLLKEPHRLALARAYLRAARELGKGMGDSIVADDISLRLLDRSATSTLTTEANPILAAEAFARAREHLASQDPDERSAAEKDLMEAISLAPENFRYWLELASFYERERMLDDARVLLRYVEENAPETTDAYVSATLELRKLGQ
jgi:serine/threonine protein kinase